MSDLNICLACGLCCKGTLIGFVHLETEELPRVRAIKEIEEEGGNGFFLQPCSSYCDGCTIYEQRPKQCASFKCKLLTSVEQQELDFNAALARVKEVEQRKVTIEEKIALLELNLQSPSFYFRMAELKNLLLRKQSELPLTPIEQDLLSELYQLDRLLENEFGVSFFR